MKRTLFMIALSCAALIGAVPAHADTMTLKNPDWREVPGTKPPVTDDEFGAVYVDMNGLRNQGNTRVFDIVDSGGEYVRIEVDCEKNRYRQLARGSFLTKTRVRFVNVNHGWLDSANNDVMAFVCRH